MRSKAANGNNDRSVEECGFDGGASEKKMMYQKEHKINILNVFVDSTNGSAYRSL